MASVAFAVLLACGLAPGSFSQAAALQEAKKRPNVVVVMSDDQNEEEAMSIRRIVDFGRGGATFLESFVTNSLC